MDSGIDGHSGGGHGGRDDGGSVAVTGVVMVMETLKSRRGWVGWGLRGGLCNLTHLGPIPVPIPSRSHLGKSASLNLTFLI